MHLQAAFTEFTYSKDHTPASQQWYRARLGAFIQWVLAQSTSDIEDVSAPLVRRYIDECRATPTKGRSGGQPLSSHPLHGHVRAIRAWLHWAAAEDLLDEKVVRRVSLPKREQRVLGILSPEQVMRLMDACTHSETPEYVMRDRTILAVLLDTDIRASELTGLTVDRVHVTPEEAYLVVHGKGRKHREVPLGKQSRQWLHKYIHRYRPRTTEPRVFLAKGGEPLTPEGLDRLLYRLRDRAGAHHFTGIRVSAHTLRHTSAVRALEEGIDVFRLFRLMRHSSVQTTEGYLKAFTSRQARQGHVSVLDNLGKGA